MFGRTGQTAGQWSGVVFVGTLLWVGACVQLAGIDDPLPKPVGQDAGENGGGGTGGNAGAGGSPNMDDGGLDAAQDAPNDASEDADAGQPPVEDLEWANWRMPNPSNLGLPNPADYTIVTGSAIVIDNLTKLTWERNVDASVVSLTAAFGYCDQLNHAGFDDWRLPTAIELISLVDFTKSAPEPLIDALAFPNTPTDWFWTATPLAGTPTSGWIVSFYDGETSTNAGSATFRVRCVR